MLSQGSGRGGSGESGGETFDGVEKGPGNRTRLIRSYSAVARLREERMRFRRDDIDERWRGRGVLMWLLLMTRLARVALARY